MLLKGLQETLAAPSPVRAAEMALIRLCYAADLPSPADALKALQSGGAPAAAPSASPAPRGGGGGGGAAARLAPQPASAVAPQPSRRGTAAGAGRAAAQSQSFTEVVALFEARREPRLVNSPDASRAWVRCEPGLIEFRPEPTAPTDLAPRLASCWANGPAGAGSSRCRAPRASRPCRSRRRPTPTRCAAAAEADPLVQAILKTFPGAKMEAVRRKGEDDSMVAGLHGVRPTRNRHRPRNTRPTTTSRKASTDVRQAEGSRRPDAAGPADAAEDEGAAGPARAAGVVGGSGAGLVKVTVNGNETRRVEIDPSLFKPEDKGVVEDLIVAAANDARGKVEADRAGADEVDHRRPAPAARLQAVMAGTADA